MRSVLFAALLAAATAPVAAMELYRVGAGGTFSCGDTKSAALALKSKTISGQAPLPDGCLALAEAFVFEVMNRAVYISSDDEDPRAPSLKFVYARTPAVPGVDWPEYFFVPFDGASAIKGPDGAYVYPSCTYPTGGVIERVVTDQQGRLVLRRFSVLTKCVDGQMKSTIELVP